MKRAGEGGGEENVIILDIDITNLLVNKHSLNNIARDAVKGGGAKYGRQRKRMKHHLLVRN